MLRFLPLVILTLALAQPALAADKKQEAKQPAAQPQAQEEKEGEEVPLDLKSLKEKLPSDTVYGNENAPLTIVEYASLSCAHCKHFYEDIFSGIRKNYIDTGKVRLVYRHFALNLPALRAAVLVECVAPEQRKKDFISALYAAQAEWGFQSNEEDLSAKLYSVMSVGGMDQAAFTACLGNKELENRLLAEQIRASKELNVSSTPTLFIDNILYKGKKTPEDIDAAIREALQLHGVEITPATMKEGKKKE